MVSVEIAHLKCAMWLLCVSVIGGLKQQHVLYAQCFLELDMPEIFS